jgi:lipopolysaccharide export system permease protein
MKFTLLNRYVMTCVIKSTLLVLLVILGFYFFISCITEVGDLGKGHYTMWRMFEYILMKLPLNCYGIFPLISLLGALLGLGLLSSSNEVTVMRAAGMSVIRISVAVLMAAFMMTIASIFVGEILGPPLAVSAEKFKVKQVSSGGSLSNNGGVWMKSGNDFIYFDNVVFKGSILKDITDYKIGADQQLVSVTVADQAVRKKNHWYLENVSTTMITSNKITIVKEEEMPWAMNILKTNLFTFFDISPREMSLLELKKLVKSQYDTGLSGASDDFIFWQRIFSPLATLTMIFLALPFMFGSLRSLTMGVRLTFGVFTGVVFLLMNKLLGSFSAAIFISPMIAAILPMVIFLFLAFYLMRRFS